ncbi:BglG family transcription antiterminator LicT [Citrobacter tructae]|uniref:BglG family transcription antiterminator LicT n=1 Tax=Citrobacter tructae TaxID=2562449 RepID=UPI003F5509F1
MNITKVLNNNVVVVIDANNNELVLIGRGLGFHKKAGDTVDARLIEKKFSLKNGEMSDRIGELLEELPQDIIAIAEKIIDLAKQKLSGNLQKSLFISLTDHCNFAIQRHRQGVRLPNILLWEIKKLHVKEYAIGLEALDIIERELDIRLDDDEAGYIAMHLVNAQLDSDMHNFKNVTQIMQEILNIVKYQLSIDYNEQSVSYHRFITHLRFFAQRILGKNTVHSDDESLHDVVKLRYKDAYECAKKIQIHIDQHYWHILTKEELMFLTIHIERVRTETIGVEPESEDE